MRQTDSTFHDRPSQESLVGHGAQLHLVEASTDQDVVAVEPPLCVAA
jgi:hypothetical protein